MDDLEGLKRVLRSLVVSTPTTMDASTLLRDYRRMVGGPLPVARYGYRDPVLFLREQCADSFLFQGPQSNPILTLIVNKAIKHIDQYVQSQKMPSKQIRGKRRSVPESMVRNTAPHRAPANSISLNSQAPKKPEPVLTQPVIRPESSRPIARPASPRPVAKAVPKPVLQPVRSDSVADLSSKMEALSNGHQEQKGTNTRLRLQSFLEAYQSQQLNRRSAESLKTTDDDSGRQTSSSSSSRSAAALAQLKEELTRLVAQHPGPVWCSQLLRLYEATYGCELKFSRFGFPSVSACACAVEGLVATRAADGDWLLAPRDAAGAASAGPAPVLRVRRPHHHRDSRASLAPLDADDALPGIDYDPDVFPADCLSFLESIPASSVADVAPGQMLAVVVGEVYSPSHLWVLRLGPDVDTMEEYMDEMTEYYGKGEGKDRVLAAGARRPGQYCSSVFEGDWHRSLIVQVLDSDTVKVLHVDYGTVDTVAAGSLRPLRRQWAGLPAQAVRAVLAGLRPAAASRRWPRAAAAHCLALVRERRLVANVVAVDHEEHILELFLIDTSTDEDVNITDQMIRAGHADRRPLPALGTGESYLFPLFRVLEAGETPNYAEIHALLRDGIALEFVDAYRRHVPSLLPSPASTPDDADTSELGSSAAPSPSPSPSPPAPPGARNRVPFAMLLPARGSGGPPRASTPPHPAAISVAISTCSPPAPPSTSPLPAPLTTSPLPAPPTTYPPPEPPSTSLLPAAPTTCPPPEPPSTSLLQAAHTTSPLPAPTLSLSSLPRPVFVFSGLVSAPAVATPDTPPVVAKEPETSTGAPAPPPASDGSGRAAAGCTGVAPGPGPCGAACCAARPAHPASVYALPFCACAPAPECYPKPAPYAYPPAPRFAPPAYAYGAYRPEPPRFAPPLYAQYPRPLVGVSPYGRDPRAVPTSTYGPVIARGPVKYVAGVAPAPAPGPGGDGASVRLSATECEVFEQLSRVNPGMAHRYMIEALQRARAAVCAELPDPRLRGTRLNPDAAEFRAGAALRPPPGFENGPK